MAQACVGDLFIWTLVLSLLYLEQILIRLVELRFKLYAT